MSELIIIAFRRPDAAFVAGENIAALQQEAGTEPEDIIVVTRDATGRVTVNQSIDLATSRPLGGGEWGTLIGMFFLDARPARTAAQGLAAQFRAAGVDPRFLEDAVKALEKGGAAVGMRVRMLGADRVLARVKDFKGSHKIFRTQLSAEAEERLIDMLEQIPPEVLTHGGTEFPGA